jgi:hydroxymethylpyrimidine pyrophosphatase-like HAD family hydrolase
LAPKSVSKLSAIQLLLKDDETIKDVIAFGDNYNDVEMLKHVGCGVAVANAREEVKAISDYTTLSNTENGVALFIQQHLVN